MYIHLVFFINTLKNEYRAEKKIRVPENMNEIDAAHLVCNYSFIHHANVQLSNKLSKNNFIYTVINEKNPRMVIISMFNQNGNEDGISTDISVISRYIEEFLHVYSNTNHFNNPDRESFLDIFVAKLIAYTIDKFASDIELSRDRLFFCNFTESKDITQSRIKFDTEFNRELLSNNGFGKKVVKYLNENNLLDPKDKEMEISAITVLDSNDTISLKIYFDQKYYVKYNTHLINAIRKTLRQMENDCYLKYYNKIVEKINLDHVEQVNITKLF